MSRKSRYQDAREAKDRRAKRMAIGGAVVLAAVLAFEIPHYLGGHKSAAPPATTTTTTPGVPGSTTTPTSTVPGVVATSVPPTTNTRLPNSDSTPRASKSQLYSFDHFASKNPFVQQAVVPAAQPSASSPSAPSSNAPTGGPPTGAANYTSAGSSARTLAKTGAATISVNGTTQTVRVGGSFPSSNPLFRLVSIAHGVARIGIANGSYSSGARTVSLTAGRALTLVDTADGVRYVVRLIAS
jgi:hypothetical protein